MKLAFGAPLLLAAALLSGCASSERQLVLDPVGPQPSYPDTASSNGTLLVFSAISVSMPSNRRPEHPHHTDYKILSHDGQLLQTVHNDYENSWEGPKEVELPAGSYQIVAPAYRYGVVTVPVVIVAHRLTKVHLEGGFAGPEKAMPIRSNPVRLPNGEIVGWRAHEESAPQAHVRAE